MRQVVPKTISKEKKKRKSKPKSSYKPYHKGNPFKKRVNKSGQSYGTSKLERDFARDFLDKLGLKYVYQYEARDIKRFFDFVLPCKDNNVYETEIKDGLVSIKQDGYLDVNLIIEIDGGFFHGDPRVVTEDKITPMHKHNMFVDKLKDKWAAEHCINLIRFWEYDIRNNPKMVMEELKKYVGEGRKKVERLEKRKKPH